MIGLVGLALIGGILTPLVNSYLNNAGSGYWANFLTILPDSFKQRKENVSREFLSNIKVASLFSKKQTME
jgi:hypothetical protein